MDPFKFFLDNSNYSEKKQPTIISYQLYFVDLPLINLSVLQFQSEVEVS